MDRLIFIVDQIDTALKEFYFKDIRFFGLSRLELKAEKHIPVAYRGFGDNEFVGFEDVNGMGIYHRLLTQSDDKDLEGGYGRSAATTENYTMKMVVFGDMRKIDDTNIDINYRISNELTTLVPSRLTQSQMDEVNARRGVINIIGRELNKETVFAEEFPQDTYKLKSETLLFSINYNLQLTYG